MAESIARYHGHEAYSGGTEPGNSVSENAIEALVERGYSTEGLIPKSIDLVYPGDYDMIISMGCGVSCPNIPINEDWELEDPVGRDLEVGPERIGVRDAPLEGGQRAQEGGFGRHPVDEVGRGGGRRGLVPSWRAEGGFPPLAAALQCRMQSPAISRVTEMERWVCLGALDISWSSQEHI